MSVVVAGAGALGCASALAIARAGAGVTVVDPGPPGEHASAIAAGMLAPVFETLFEPDAAGDLARLSDARDLWPDLARSIGLPLDRTGAMAVGPPDDVDAWVRRLDALGARGTPLSPAEARRRSPGLREGWCAVHTPDDWRLEPGLALASLRRATQDAGGRFLAAAVEAFEPGRVRLAGGESLPADQLVIATGASPALVGQAPELASLSPIKGHILTAPDIVLAGPVLRFVGGYVCPGGAGALIGATMEPGLADTRVDPDQARALRQAAARALPSLATVRTVARVGVRAATPDGLPLVGSSRTPGVWVAAGARRNGWLLAPAVAEALVRALSGKDALAALAPSRFDGT